MDFAFPNFSMEKKRQFTWEELSSLNKEDNAHVAVRGKVRLELRIYAPVLIGSDHDRGYFIFLG